MTTASATAVAVGVKIAGSERISLVRFDFSSPSIAVSPRWLLPVNAVALVGHVFGTVPNEPPPSLPDPFSEREDGS